MERRNFFTKIGKGLLGLGIFSALPKVETPAEATLPSASINLTASPTELDLRLPDDIQPSGMAEGENGKLYVVEGDKLYRHDDGDTIEVFKFRDKRTGEWVESENMPDISDPHLELVRMPPIVIPSYKPTTE